IYLSLIEEPTRGRQVNRLFSSRAFWAAGAIVFVLQGLDALHAYAPARWPPISLGFKLAPLFMEDPWRFMELHFKQQRIYFTIVGIAFFLQSRVAFSLWIFFVGMQVVRMFLGTHQTELNVNMELDQLFG